MLLIFWMKHSKFPVRKPPRFVSCDTANLGTLEIEGSHQLDHLTNTCLISNILYLQQNLHSFLLQTASSSWSCHSCSLAKSSPTLCDPMGHSALGFPVHHYFLEFAQIHVHWVSDVIQRSYPLSLPSPALNLSQHRSLFQRVASLYQVAKVLELKLQHQTFQWMFRVDFLEDWLVWYPCSPSDSQESSPAPQFKSINTSVLSLL